MSLVPLVLVLNSSVKKIATTHESFSQVVRFPWFVVRDEKL